MKIVLDNNVLLSSFLWKGSSSLFLKLAKEEFFKICVNQEIIDEFYKVLSYSKFKTILSKRGLTNIQVKNELLEITDFCPSLEFSKPIISEDPSVDIFFRMCCCREGFFYH